MNRYLLLILLTSWSLLVTEACDTGVAFANSVLSVGRSSLANADVALLETYTAETVEKCMEDCCSGKYGACSIASFKKNTTKKNCLHFYCRPLKQCKFLSSSSIDSFTFSSNPHALHPVPSSHNLTTTSTTPPTTTAVKAKPLFDQPQAVEEIATFSEEQDDLKNDNTSVKPRKGVDALNPDDILSKPGVKPRKGVTLEDVPHSKFLLKGLNKSNVKPRKGVGNYSSSEAFTEDNILLSNITLTNETSVPSINSSNKLDTMELVSELAELFQDDSATESSTVSHSATSLHFYTISPTSASNIYTASSSLKQSVTSEIHLTSTTDLLISSSSHLVQSSFSSTPYLSSLPSYVTTTAIPSATVAAEQSSFTMPIASAVPSLSARAHLSMDEPKPLDKLLASEDSEESENRKRYTSSMHLVLSLVFGLLVLFGVLGVVAKRMYDSWQRRDYYRMNYLIDGIYNGYE